MINSESQKDPRPKARSEMAEAGSQRDADDCVDRLITGQSRLFVWLCQPLWPARLSDCNIDHGHIFMILNEWERSAINLTPGITELSFSG